MYSGGELTDGNYSLLSEAIKNELFHPRCKDSTSTYYEGVTTLKPVTSEEMAEMDRREKLEQQHSYYQNQAIKNQRIADYSLDEDNKRIYQYRANQSQKKADELGKKLDKSVEKSTEHKDNLTNVGTIEEYNKLKARGKTPTKAVKPAKTANKAKNAKEEAEKIAKSFGVNADYSKYDISVANALNETMQRAIDEFGLHALDALKSIGTDTKKGREGGFDSFTGKLSLSGVSGKNALFKMGEKTRKANQRYASMGIKYFSAEGDLCVIHHEMGHAIHSSLGGSIDTAATPLDREIISFMRSRRKDTTTQVSFYAEKNNQELVAECIAQYFDGSASEITLGVIEILKKHAKKK